MIKKITALITVLLLILAPAGILAASYDPPKDVYVADYANVIDSETERYIIETGKKLDEKTGAQIVIMTVDFVDGDFEDFCYEIFNSWGIGDSVKNNGILLVMSIGDQDAYCLQGAGLEKSLTSGMIGDMLNEYLADDFFSGNYSEGARHIFDAFCDWLCRYYDVSLSTANTTPAPVNQGNNGNSGYTINNNTESGNDTWSLIVGIIALVIILIIIVMVIRLIFRPRYRIYNGTNYYWSYHRPSSHYYNSSYGPNTYYIPGYNPHSYHSGTSSGSSNHSFWGSGHSSSGSSYSGSHTSSGYSSGSSHSSGYHSGSNHGGNSSHISNAGSSHSGSHISHSSSSGGSHSGGFGGGGSRGGGSGFGKR